MTITGVKSHVSYRITVLAKNGVSDVAGVSYHNNASLMFTIPKYNSNIGKYMYVTSTPLCLFIMPFLVPILLSASAFTPRIGMGVSVLSEV